jgi:hypothetical protein
MLLKEAFGVPKVSERAMTRHNFLWSQWLC